MLCFLLKKQTCLDVDPPALDRLPYPSVMLIRDLKRRTDAPVGVLMSADSEDGDKVGQEDVGGEIEGQFTNPASHLQLRTGK
jgi:hypothetical protein